MANKNTNIFESIFFIPIQIYLGLLKTCIQILLFGLIFATMNTNKNQMKKR